MANVLMNIFIVYSSDLIVYANVHLLLWKTLYYYFSCNFVEMCYLLRCALFGNKMHVQTNDNLESTSQT